MDNSYKDRKAIHRTPPPNPSEIRELLARVPISSPPARNFHDVVLIVATTGVRRGELSDLKWSDVDLDRRRFRVGQKSTAGVRLVPFGPRVLETLKERRKHLPDAEHILGNSPTNALQGVSIRLAQLSELACGRRINLHSIRHFFCAQCMALGSRPESLARVVGWSLSRRPFFRPFDHPCESEMTAAIQEQIEKSITS